MKCRPRGFVFLLFLRLSVGYFCTEKARVFFFFKKRALKQNVVHRWKKEQFAKQLLAAFPSRQNDTLCRVLLFLATFFGAIPTMDSIFIWIIEHISIDIAYMNALFNFHVRSHSLVSFFKANAETNKSQHWMASSLMRWTFCSEFTKIYNT